MRPTSVKKNPRKTPDIAFWGTVVASYGRHFSVASPDGNLYEAHRRGKKDDVVVGDAVGCTAPLGHTVAIESIRERHSLLFRSDRFKTKELAANVDVALVVFSPVPAFNPEFVWRAVIAALAAGVTPIAVRNKCDLSDGREATDAFASQLESLGVRVLRVSAKTDQGALREALSPVLTDRTAVLVGQSGMGKSTILNAICPRALARTQEISLALNSGKQTTTETRAYPIEAFGGHSTLIDSPGFTEFGLAHLTEEALLCAMPDLADAVDGCRFYNCAHINEPGCSVLKAIEEGRVSASRHALYVKLIHELRDARRPL